MDPIDRLKEEELISTLIEESAKANNELRCASRDIAKAQNRQSFVLLLLNRLMERKNATQRPSQRT
mgnify:FL=1